MARITNEEKESFHKLVDASLIKLEVEKNVKKTHWSKLSIKCLQKMLAVEAAELDLAVNHGNNCDILSECDDIINFALFIKHNIIEGLSNEDNL